MRIRLLAFAAFVSVALQRPANACSPVAAYEVPTTLELIEQADAIVVARVGDEVPAKDDFSIGELVLRPEVLIAGTALPAEIRIRGQHGSDRFQPTPSNPKELAKANPDAFMGACNRYIFNRGMLLVLFLKNGEAGKIDVIDAPFARTLEDVPNADSLWVRAIRYYASIVRLPPGERKKAMKAESARLRLTGVQDDALLANDIERQIKRKRTQNYD